MGSIAQHITTEGNTNGQHREITVLVTGFGPFQDKHPVNPSYEIARSLSSTLPTVTASGRELHVIGYGTPIRVCYKEVRELVPVLHESYLGIVDLVLHIGMASGRDHYTAELYGHRDGYIKNKDLDGRTLPIDDGLIHFGDCPASMTTSLDYEEVLRSWKRNVAHIPETSPANGADCRPSEHAGHYLCDYIYFNSLAWFGRRHEKLDGGIGTDRPVLFLHVPAESDPQTLEKGRQVTLALIEAMVDNWCHSTLERVT